jgi:carbonyl reductase 1
MASPQRVLVTGGNSGIGLALCRQLATEHGCHVLMGSRDTARGEAAVASLDLPADCAGRVELVTIDVSDAASVAAAAAHVEASLGRLDGGEGGGRLHALVNNAGIGLSASATPEQVMATNLHGTRRVTDAFLPLLLRGGGGGRIVNVGSGAGGGYVQRCPTDRQRALCVPPASWEAIEALVCAASADGKTGLGSAADTMGGYGPSKAGVALHAMLVAAQQPSLVAVCCTPGFIDTKLTAGFGASKSPEEGTAAIRHCLFAPVVDEGAAAAADGTGLRSGWYFGSDAVRSPLHFMRNPGEPPYDGVPPS